MHFNLDWQIFIGDYQLGFMSSCEVHASVDLLTDTCTIILPGFAYNKAFRVEEKIKRGDKVLVKFGYDGKLNTEFEGYLLNINTDNGSFQINCEDSLFEMRKQVKDRQFLKASIKTILQYLVSETGVDLKIDAAGFEDSAFYDKFVISKATAYDVLKKLQEETKANVYIKIENETKTLHFHPLYSESHGYVSYSFQHNIEESSLKFMRKEDRRIEVIIESVGKDGKTTSVRAGTTGGDRETIKVSGLSKAAMQQRADSEYKQRSFDGYEGDITTWLIPTVGPGDSAEVVDEDFEYKNGIYFVTAITSTMDENGGKRKVQLGIKLGDL